MLILSELLILTLAINYDLYTFPFSKDNKVLNIYELHVHFIIGYCDQVNERCISIYDFINK